MATLLKFESGMAGATWVYNPGDIVQWDNDAEADRLIERLVATPVYQGADQDVSRCMAELRVRGAFIRNHAIARERDRRQRELELVPYNGMPPLSDLPDSQFPKSMFDQEEYKAQRNLAYLRYCESQRRQQPKVGTGATMTAHDVPVPT